MSIEKNIGTLSEETVRQISQEKNEPKWMLEKRLEAFSKIRSTELESFVYGLGIRIDSTGFNLDSFDYSESLKNQPIRFESPKGVVVSDLHEALKTHGEIIKNHLFSIPSSASRISAIHGSLWSRGLFIYVPKGIEATIPINYFSKLDRQTLLENVLVIAEPFSKLSIVDFSESGNNEKSFRSQEMEIFAKESSKIEFCGVQNLSENVFNISDRKAVTEKDSLIEWIICDIGGGVTKSDVITYLNGEGSSVKNIGLFLGKDNQQFDFSVTAVHKSAHTLSDMLTKGALTGKSKSVYRGYIKIKNTAPKSSGYQKADMLLLSPNAEADPIPNLEIDNNDIEKCTHGATVGQIDKEKLFYMMSRGLTEKDATKQVVNGLFSPAMSRINSDLIKNNLNEILEKKMENL